VRGVPVALLPGRRPAHLLDTPLTDAYSGGMAIHSRNKGANAEREVRDIVRAAGFECIRDGQIYDDDDPNDDLAHNIPGVHIEVKRRETLAIPAWCRQAEDDARGRVPWVVFRQSKQPWRAVVPFVFMLNLTAMALAQHAEIAAWQELAATCPGPHAAERDWDEWYAHRAKLFPATGDAAMSG
jgi:Holliday junction resolvase